MVANALRLDKKVLTGVEMSESDQMQEDTVERQKAKQIRHRRIYIQQRLQELKAEMNTLRAELDEIKLTS